MNKRIKVCKEKSRQTTSRQVCIRVSQKCKVQSRDQTPTRYLKKKNSKKFGSRQKVLKKINKIFIEIHKDAQQIGYKTIIINKSFWKIEQQNLDIVSNLLKTQPKMQLLKTPLLFLEVKNITPPSTKRMGSYIMKLKDISLSEASQTNKKQSFSKKIKWRENFSKKPQQAPKSVFVNLLFSFLTKNRIVQILQ